MIDTHTHLDRLADPVAAIAAAKERGVEWVLSVGTDPASTRAALAIGRVNDGFVRVACGIHPTHGDSYDDPSWEAVEELVKDPLVVAVGETGIDLFRPGNPPLAQQTRMFERHCDLARRHRLPLIIHTRGCEEEMLTALDEFAQGLTVVMHCFSMPDHLGHVLERGWYVSFAGNVTYNSAGDLRAAAAQVPADRLLLETDAPYLAPVPHRGEKNEPAFVLDTLDCVAAARGADPVTLGHHVQENAERIFTRHGATIA